MSFFKEKTFVSFLKRKSSRSTEAWHEEIHRLAFQFGFTATVTRYLPSSSPNSQSPFLSHPPTRKLLPRRRTPRKKTSPLRPFERERKTCFVSPRRAPMARRFSLVLDLGLPALWQCHEARKESPGKEESHEGPAAKPD